MGFNNHAEALTLTYAAASYSFITSPGIFVRVICWTFRVVQWRPIHLVGHCGEQETRRIIDPGVRGFNIAGNDGDVT